MVFFSEEKLLQENIKRTQQNARGSHCLDIVIGFGVLKINDWMEGESSKITQFFEILMEGVIKSIKKRLDVLSRRSFGIGTENFGVILRFLGEES